MKVLVTGGAGFIGSHLCGALVRKGHRVRVLDDFSSGRRENLADVARDVELVKGDCADPAAARKAVKGVEAVLHEAAMPSVPRSIADPARSHTTNATATLNMLLAARDAGVKRFIYAGSSSVYGDQPGSPKRETMTPRPLSPYAVGKLTGEHYVRLFAELFGLETFTLRYFNVFGPRQDSSSPYSGVISLFATLLRDGAMPTIYGDGRQTRDFTYVDDVVTANLLALEARGAKGQAMNVARGEGITLLRLLREVARLCGAAPRAKHAAVRKGDIRHSIADVSLARRVLGYSSHVTFEEGLRRTVEWYRAEREPRAAAPRARSRRRA
jgi:nucleoside-diphosphate-sugar epimerase